MSKKLKFFAMMLTCILLNANYVWAADDTWSHTFTSTGTVTITDGATTLNGKSWAIATTTGQGSPTCTSIVNGYTKAGWQFGSNKNNYYSNVTLSTSAFSSYSVKSVSVVIRLNANVSTTVAVSQGATNIGSNTVNTANEWHTLTAETTAGTSGNVSISITTTQAFFINSISVTYAAGGSTKTLVYDANDGSGEMANTTGESVSAAACTFTAPACKVFDHWNTEANNSGTSYNAGASVPSSTTLYAIWRNNPSDPTQTFSNGSYTTGGSALDLSTLFRSNSSGAVTYSVTNADGTGASIAGSSFTATTAGSCTVQASQAADAPCYNAKTATATITVSAPTSAKITLNNYSGSATTTGYHSGESFTLPSTNDFTCGDLTFVGWSSVTINDPSATKPASNYYEPGESVTLGASNTFYAVFAEASGGGGSKTATISQNTLYSGISGTQAYGNAASSLDDDQDYSWTVKANSQVTGPYRYIQMRIYSNENGVSYIQLPDYPGNISSISLTVSSTSGNTPSAGSNSTTLYLCADAEANVDDPIASGSGASAITLTPTSNVSTGYIKAGGGIRIWAISATYSSTSYTNYTTNCVNMRTVYLDAYHFGDSDGAKFAIYSWENADATNNLLAETFMEKVTSCYSDHLYVGEFPDDHDRVIFLRNAPEAVTPVKEGGNKWNQTSNISTDGDKDLYTIASGGGGDTYTGSWSVYTPHFAVTFDKNGAGETTTWPSDQCIANGGKASEPSSPQTMGKRFVGWYQEVGGVNAWVFNTNTVSAATTIYAKWNDVATKTIYLDASATLDGGNTWDSGNTVLFARAYIDGTSIGTNIKATGAISSCQPHVYQFVIPGNATHVSFARCATGTESLPAEWAKPPVYNQIAGKTVESGKDHYVIDGWGSATLQSSAFTPVSYTITYNAGTNGTGSRANDSKLCGVAFTLPNSQVFTRNGYTMDGWATSDGGDKVYYLGESYKTDANLNLYPHWTEATYRVTLTTNGGTINAGNVTSYVYGTGATLPTNVTKDHATFQGWYASSTFEGERVYSIGASEFGDKTYWAKWEAITYTVTWKANGSIFHTDNNVVDGNTLSAPTPAPGNLTTGSDGCDAEFVGWVIEANDPGALSISSQSSTPSGLFTTTSPAITANTTFIAIYRQEQ